MRVRVRGSTYETNTVELRVPWYRFTSDSFDLEATKLHFIVAPTTFRRFAVTTDGMDGWMDGAMDGANKYRLKNKIKQWVCIHTWKTSSRDPWSMVMSDVALVKRVKRRLIVVRWILDGWDGMWRFIFTYMKGTWSKTAAAFWSSLVLMVAPIACAARERESIEGG